LPVGLVDSEGRGRKKVVKRAECRKTIGLLKEEKKKEGGGGGLLPLPEQKGGKRESLLQALWEKREGKVPPSLKGTGVGVSEITVRTKGEGGGMFAGHPPLARGKGEEKNQPWIPLPQRKKQTRGGDPPVWLC